MKFSERNEILKGIVERCGAIHAKYTSTAKELTEGDWSKYISLMDDIAGEYKETSIADFAGQICMAYLNDTELVQKKLKEVERT